jgi:hypothetical protein
MAGSGFVFDSYEWIRSKRKQPDIPGSEGERSSNVYAADG